MLVQLALLDALGTRARTRRPAHSHQYPSQDFTCGLRAFVLLIRSRPLRFRCRLVLGDSSKRCRVDGMRGGARKTVLQSEPGRNSSPPTANAAEEQDVFTNVLDDCRRPGPA